MSAPDVNAYVMEHGRLPRLGESPQPWEYRGHLLYIVQLCDNHPEAPHRWNYYMETLEAGHLLEAPIPQVQFHQGGPLQSEAKKNLEKWIDQCFHEHGSWSALPRLVDWLAWGLAVSKEQPKFSDKLNEWLWFVIETLVSAFVGALIAFIFGSHYWAALMAFAVWVSPLAARIFARPVKYARLPSVNCAGNS